MTILPLLENNKGMLSSALGKTLAAQVLAGDQPILVEAVGLLAYPDKNVRSGAAKIVEQVAETRPEWVAPYTRPLLDALEMPEAQTRWMAIHTLGLCASIEPAAAGLALPKAQEFILADSGVCLWDRTIVYLGYLGATSPGNLERVMPLLENALERIPGQTRTVLEAFQRCACQADTVRLARLAAYASEYTHSTKPAVKAAAIKLDKQVRAGFGLAEHQSQP
jgi:hypothetical protein